MNILLYLNIKINKNFSYLSKRNFVIKNGYIEFEAESIKN